MISRASIDHQQRMLRHLEQQTATLKAGTTRLKDAVSQSHIPSVMTDAICPRCRIRYLKRDGSCACQEGSQ